MTSAAERAATVERGIRASLTGDSSIVGEVFTSDVHATLPTAVQCASDLAVEIEDRRDVFVDVDLAIASTGDRDDRIWVEWCATVTHVGTLFVDDELVAPSGRRAEVRGVTVADFEGERIAGFRQYWDYSGLLREQEPRTDDLRELGDR